MGLLDRLRGKTTPTPSTQTKVDRLELALYRLAKKAYQERKMAKSDAEKHQKTLFAVILLDKACRLACEDTSRKKYIARWRQLFQELLPHMQKQAIQHARTTCSVATQSMAANPHLVHVTQRMQDATTLASSQATTTGQLSARYSAPPQATTTIMPLSAADDAFERLREAAYAESPQLMIKLYTFLQIIDHNPGMAREAVHKALSRLNPSVERITLLPAVIYEADHENDQTLTTALLRVASGFAAVIDGRFLPLACDITVACARLAPPPNHQDFATLCVATIQHILEKSERHTNQDIRDQTKGFYQNIAAAINIKDGRLRTEFTQRIASHRVTEHSFEEFSGLFNDEQPLRPNPQAAPAAIPTAQAA